MSNTWNTSALAKWRWILFYFFHPVLIQVNIIVEIQAQFLNFRITTGNLKKIMFKKITQIGMIMKATRMLTIRLEEDKQWRIRQYLSFILRIFVYIFWQYFVNTLFWKYSVNFNWEYYVNIFDNILSISLGNILAIYFSISFGNILLDIIFQVWDHFQSKINEGIQHNNPGKGIILSVFWIMSTKYHWSKNTGKKVSEYKKK